MSEAVAMKRSPGVTAAAVVAILGSALSLLMAVLVLLSVVLVGSLPASRGGPALTGAALVAPILFYIALGAWGIATALGLFRLRPWSRISILIFSGLLICGCLLTTIVMLVIPIPIPPNSDLQASAIPMIRGIFVALFAVPCAVGVWWMIFFNLKSTREQFTGIAPPPLGIQGTMTPAPSQARPAGRPVSITIVACLYLLGVASLPYSLSGNYPLIVFNRLLWGGPAKAAFVGMAAIALYAGIGLFRMRPDARIVGIGLSAFNVLSSVFFVLMPGAGERFAAVLSVVNLPDAPNALTASSMLWIMKFSMLVGAGLSIAILWILIASKPAFERAAALSNR